MLQHILTIFDNNWLWNVIIEFGILYELKYIHTITFYGGVFSWHTGPKCGGRIFFLSCRSGTKELQKLQ